MARTSGYDPLVQGGQPVNVGALAGSATCWATMWRRRARWSRPTACGQRPAGENRALRTELDALRRELAGFAVDRLLGTASESGGVRFMAGEAQGAGERGGIARRLRGVAAIFGQGAPFRTALLTVLGFGGLR